MSAKPTTTPTEKQGAKPAEKTSAKPARMLGQAFAEEENSDEDLDALRWTERSRRRLKEQAAEQAKQAKKKLKTAPKTQYSAANLAGIKVAHSLADFSAAGNDEEHVLTLQDKNIDDLDDDSIELQSTALVDAERGRKNAEARKTQMQRMGGVQTTSALDINSDDNDKPSAFFTISAGGVIDETPQEKEQRELRLQRGQVAVSLDADNIGMGAAVVSDFYTAAEAATMFRKPRKSKKSKSSSKRTTDNNDFAEIVDAERVNSLLTRKAAVDDSQFIDDDEDLQRTIANVRRVSTRKKSAKGALTAEEISRQVRVEAQAQMDVAQAQVSDDSSNLVLSSTIEFVQALKAASASAKSAIAPAPIPVDIAIKETSEYVQAIAETDANEDGEEEAAESEARIVKGGSSRSVVAAPIAATNKRAGLIAASSNNATKPVEPADLLTLNEPEPIVGSGLFATLSLLRQRNMIDRLSEEQKQRERQQRSRDEWIAEQRRKESALQLERQRIKQMGRQPTDTQTTAPVKGGRRGKADEMTQKELDEIKVREQEMLDRKWAREYEERMKDYKPEVKLEYVDEAGRELTTKEAYKQLSHAFHGHYSGKNKVDRVNRQREREHKQQEHNSSTSTHQQAAIIENAHRKMGTPGIDLTQIMKQNPPQSSSKK
ncbi:hypothetical protein GGF37_001566 [Kickxella alabastrina]|nr:hypothetical protein GGF37_001566 [Kickxella alabastrina]